MSFANCAHPGGSATPVIPSAPMARCPTRTFAAIMANLHPKKVKVGLVLTSAPTSVDRRQTTDGSSRSLASTPTFGWASGATGPNVAGMSSDGIHMVTNEAKEAYASLIAGWVSRALRQAGT